MPWRSEPPPHSSICGLDRCGAVSQPRGASPLLCIWAVAAPTFPSGRDHGCQGCAVETPFTPRGRSVADGELLAVSRLACSPCCSNGPVAAAGLPLRVVWRSGACGCGATREDARRHTSCDNGSRVAPQSVPCWYRCVPLSRLKMSDPQSPADVLAGRCGLVKVTGLDPENVPAHASIWEVFGGAKGPDRPHLAYQRTTLETAMPQRKERVGASPCPALPMIAVGFYLARSTVWWLTAEARGA